MNIYKVKRLDDWDYDEFDSIVCYSENEDNAKKIQPQPCLFGEKYFAPYWKEENLKVELIGYNDKVTEESIILSSFNAG